MNDIINIAALVMLLLVVGMIAWNASEDEQ